MNYVVYVLYSKRLQKYYVGETVDIVQRIHEHNMGIYQGSFTSQSNDWELYLSFEVETRVIARKIETHIKKMKSKVYIENLKKYPEMIIKLKREF
ncbi:GIY-YIG nuclease family protein [Arenibacter sp. BSSL-BM3]|uniref:GIY-YIG nuclease family protein n=1 Tax=Arenibacter arenosicollis TaxID=2762274 RepID=A0ABR7QJU2_9FLAO|nr:GIY-YIG nuclease family protein [Arenibacter arenosicollis]MBC8767369.1 GIY-YIG nuclease family protein [Arenibacter arenosicollis]